MDRRYFVYILGLAAFSILLISFLMWHTAHEVLPDQKFNPFPKSPFKTFISGSGVIEPSSGSIFLAAPQGRTVEKVEVSVGSVVKKDQVLFLMNDLDLQAELQVQKMTYENAVANLQKLEDYPRPEDLAIAEAAFNSAKVELEQAKSQYEAVQGLQNNALSREEVNRRNFNYQLALAKEIQAQADFQKVKTGTWHPDLLIARFQAEQAQAGVGRVQAELDRTIIRSPIDGTVLQVNIHAGEFANPPAMVIGNIQELYVKVNINQFDVPYFKPTSPASAFLQGDVKVEFPLEFVRLDPYLVDKQNLSNDIRQISDTRVLPVIYKIKHQAIPLYVGQLMDVFIQTEYAQ